MTTAFMMKWFAWCQAKNLYIALADVAQLVGAASCASKSGGFDSRSGPVPRLQVSSIPDGKGGRWLFDGLMFLAHIGVLMFFSLEKKNIYVQTTKSSIYHLKIIANSSESIFTQNCQGHTNHFKIAKLNLFCFYKYYISPIRLGVILH